jgi:hypothetical protein
METTQKQSKNLPKIETYETNEEFKTLATQSLESKEKAIYYMGSVENLTAVFDEDYDKGYYIPTRMERNVFLKMLIPETPAMIEYKERDSEENRETRFLKEELLMDNSIMLYDDKVIFFSDSEEKYALSMTSNSIAESMKKIFNKMWQTS